MLVKQINSSFNALMVKIEEEFAKLGEKVL